VSLLVRKLESIVSLSEEVRQAILSLPARTRVLNDGQDIVREGDKPSQSCFILDGWAYRYKMLSEGRRQILSFHIPGDIPDLQSLHIHTMDHSLATLTKSTVAFIPHESLLDLTNRFPSAAAVLWRETLIDAAIFREWMTGIGRRDAYGRIAHLFCELYLKQEAMGLASEHHCPWPLTQFDLGDATGLSNVHINRTLQHMRGAGVITLRSSTLTIHAWSELVRAAEFDPTYLHLAKRTGD
jgi:CRP-like cAMP-binding protein